MFDLDKIAALSKLSLESLSETEREQLAVQMEQLAAFAKQLSPVTLPEQSDTESAVSDQLLREDVCGSPLSREQALSAAPKQVDGCFYVPKIVTSKEDGKDV